MAINLTNPFGMVTIQPNIGPITPVMPAPTNIPNLTGFGDRLATIGGFGDDPNELKTQEELEKMTQAEIDAYVKKRKQARRLGLSESLITIGEAFQGKDATTNAIERAQARQNQQSRKNLQKQYEEAVAIAEKTDPGKATLLKNLGLAGYANVNQKIAENLLLPAKDSRTAFQKDIQFLLGKGFTFDQAADMLDKGPNINIDTGQKVFQQEAAKSAFKLLEESQKVVNNFADLEPRLDILEKQLAGGDPVQTGVIEEIKIPFKRIAAGLNILPQEELDNLNQQELFLSITSYLIPRMRVAGSGSTSDTEITLFRSAVPNLGNTVEGNKVLVGGLQALAKHNKKRLFLMEKYIKENGNLLGFGEFADQKLGPVFKSYNSDADFDNKVKSGEIKAGDFVFDAINGQFRVLSEEDVSGI